MTIEVIKLDDGSFRWRMRDDAGRLLKITPAKINAPGSAAQKRRVREAMQHVLEEQWKLQQASEA